MTTPVQSFQSPDGRRLYTGLDRAGRFESVTTILQALPKPALVPWAAREAAATAVELMRDMEDDDWSKTTPLLPWCTKDDGVDWELLEDDIARAYELSRDAGSDLGTLVHDEADELLRVSRGRSDIFDAMLADRAEDLDPDVLKRLEGLGRFLHDVDLTVVDNEFTLYNDTIGYAGQCDLAAWVKLPKWERSRPFFLDIKTNKSIYNDISLQIAAYAHGEYIVDSDAYDKHRFKRAMPFENDLGEWERDPYGGILHVTADGTKLFEVDISDSMFDAFCALALVRKLWYNGVNRESKPVLLYPKKGDKG